MAQPRGPRGERCTAVVWTDTDGTQHIELYAALGVRATKHPSASDRMKELMEAGIPGADIVLSTQTIK